MSTITYTCLNEGMRKILEYPPRVGSLIECADTLQTVLSTVPLGEVRSQEINDNDITYFYSSNGRFMIGVACRRMAGQHELPPAEMKQVRAFLNDTIKLAPSVAHVALSAETLNQIQGLLKARLEATTDAKINDVNANIARARATMEQNIEMTLARGDDVARMQATSDQLAQSAGELEAKSQEVNNKMCWQRFKLCAVIVLVVIVIICVLVAWICDPDLSGCLPASATAGGATTAAPATTYPPIIHID